MNLKHWGLLGSVLGAAALVGCDESAMDQVQDEQEDVLEAQQELRQEEAELRQATEDARVEDAGGPVLTPPEETTPTPATQPTTTPNAGDPAGSPAPVPAPEGFEADDAPNEGNPDAGTAAEDQASGSGDLVPGSRE